MARVGGTSTPKATAVAPKPTTVTPITDAPSTKKATRATKKKPSAMPGGMAAWSGKHDGRDDSAVPAGLEPDAVETHVYGSSSMGSCVTALAALATGHERAPMPDGLTAALQEGVDNEPVLLQIVRNEKSLRSVTYPELAQMKEAGQIAGYDPVRKEVQLRMPVGKAIVRGHLDDLMVVNEAEAYWSYTSGDPAGDSGLTLVEVKAFAQSTWDKWIAGGFDAFPNYAWQASSNMHCARAMFGYDVRLLFVVGLKDDETKLCAETDMTWVNEPPIEIGQFRAKIIKAEAMANKGELAVCELGNYPCPVYYMAECAGNKAAKDRARVVLDDDELGAMLSLFFAFDTDMKEVAEERDKVKKRIDKHMADKGYDRSTKENPAKFKVVSGANTFNFEWVVQNIDAEKEPRKATTRSFPSVKLADS